jgi:hypothetical protein
MEIEGKRDRERMSDRQSIGEEGGSISTKINILA